MLLQRPPHGRFLGRGRQGRRRVPSGRARDTRRRRQRLDHRTQRLPAPTRRGAGDARQAGPNLQGRGMIDAGVAQPAAPLAFSYSRALAPTMWAFASIMAVELVVVHLLVTGLWSRTAAAILSILSLAALVWTIIFIRSLRRLPVLVDAAGVTMRVGSLRSLLVPAGQVAGIRTAWPGDALKQRTVL